MAQKDIIILALDTIIESQGKDATIKVASVKKLLAGL
jgi:hypothetical protein